MFGAHDVVDPARVEIKHVSIQKEHGVERLILRGGAHVLVYGQGREKLFDFVASHVSRVAFSMKADEPLDPVEIGVFRADAIVTQTNRRADLVKQLGLLSCQLKGRARNRAAGERVFSSVRDEPGM